MFIVAFETRGDDVLLIDAPVCGCDWTSFNSVPLCAGTDNERTISAVCNNSTVDITARGEGGCVGELDAHRRYCGPFDNTVHMKVVEAVVVLLVTIRGRLVALGKRFLAPPTFWR